MQILLEDVRFALRNFLRSPGICGLIVVTLALGIGANAAMFSMVYNVLLGPLPFSEGDRLIKLETNHPAVDRYDVTVSVPTALDYINDNETLSHLVEYHQMAFTLLGHGDPSNVEAGVVSWDFFEMLKVRPILGRTFLPGEDEPGAKPLIVLANHYWHERFGGNPDVVGMNLEMNNAVHQVIGVLPPLPAYPFKNDIWIGSSSCPGRGSDMFIGQRSRPISALYGKLESGVSLEKASLDINTISNRLQTEYSDVYPESVGLSNTLTPMKTDMAGNSATTFYLLMGITGLVLLIACANVANLNLARMAARKQEFAIREALGANPRRIAGQILTESILLSLAGGLLGLLIAYFSIDLLASFASLYTPLASEVAINGSVLAFCLVVSVLTGILSGASAAFQKRNINEALKEGSGNITASGASQRLRQALLIAQFGLSFVILTSASLVSLSLYRLSNQDIGFETTDIVAVDLSTSADVRTDFVRETARLLEDTPEIGDTAFATTVPLDSGLHRRRLFHVEGRPPADMNQRPEAMEIAVSANYHEVLEIPLLRGRYLNGSDDEHNPGSILINRRFADDFFRNDDPVGKRLSMDEGKTWRTIRGVVGNVREMGIDERAEPMFYVPYVEGWRYELRLLIRSEVSLPSLRDTITDAVHEVNPRQAVASITMLRLIKDDWLSSSKLVSVLVSLFALLAFIITLSGVIGVVAYNVGMRRKEIGIRVALGASPKRIRRMFMLQGLSLSIAGIVLGSIVMGFLSPLLGAVLFETNPLNLPMYLATALVVGFVATIAILFPTQQATAIEPNVALREQ